MITRTRVKHIARQAFTLMEVLVVVAILLVLAGSAGVLYMKYLEDARYDTAKTKAVMLGDACEAYKIRHGTYPDSLDTLAMPDADGGKPSIEQSMLFDPWQQRYVLDHTGQHHNGLKCDVYSPGPPGENRPVGNW
jgi:general secretion pathway protein G